MLSEMEHPAGGGRRKCLLVSWQRLLSASVVSADHVKEAPYCICGISFLPSREYQYLTMEN